MSTIERPSCPCKRLALHLSSFTAAEYGDVYALQKQYGQRRLHRSRYDSAASTSADASAATMTPLHLAAQHGHVAATAYLLFQQPSALAITSQNSCSPLHRASYSGAVATLQLLLWHYEQSGNNNNFISNPDWLLQPDTSFGDNRTPLHKAAESGRYLAIQLLLQGLDKYGLVHNALTALDAAGQTPLHVAQAYAQQQLAQTISMSSRWNVVAGGSPDWIKCVNVSA